MQWVDRDKQRAVNVLADAAIGEFRRTGAGSPGVYAFGIVNAAPDRFSMDGQPAVLFELPSTERLLVMPVRENAALLTDGSRWQIYATLGDTVEVTLHTAVGKSMRVADLIHANYLVAEQDEE